MAPSGELYGVKEKIFGASGWMPRPGYVPGSVSDHNKNFGTTIASGSWDYPKLLITLYLLLLLFTYLLILLITYHIVAKKSIKNIQEQLW